MLKIDSLTSLQGRKLIQQIYLDLKYHRQISGIKILLLLWRICTKERDFSKYVKQDIQILHILGFFSGTSLWLQEVVNRFYYSTVNSFVYFGAAIILLVIGLRRFYANVPDWLVISSIGFEASMLVLLFVIMFFSPAEDETNQSEENTEGKELITEIGELSREIAMVSVQLESIVDNIKSLNGHQINTLDKFEVIASSLRDAVSPNPEMLQSMKDLNQEIANLKGRIIDLNKSAEAIKTEEIKIQIRSELQNIIENKLK